MKRNTKEQLQSLGCFVLLAVFVALIMGLSLSNWEDQARATKAWCEVENNQLKVLRVCTTYSRSKGTQTYVVFEGSVTRSRWETSLFWGAIPVEGDVWRVYANGRNVWVQLVERLN